jgi:hypothetical protein
VQHALLASTLLWWDPPQVQCAQTALKVHTHSLRGRARAQSVHPARTRHGRGKVRAYHVAWAPIQAWTEPLRARCALLGRLRMDKIFY